MYGTKRQLNHRNWDKLLSALLHLAPFSRLSLNKLFKSFVLLFQSFFPVIVFLFGQIGQGIKIILPLIVSIHFIIKIGDIPFLIFWFVRIVWIVQGCRKINCVAILFFQLLNGVKGLCFIISRFIHISAVGIYDFGYLLKMLLPKFTLFDIIQRGT